MNPEILAVQVWSVTTEHSTFSLQNVGRARNPTHKKWFGYLQWKPGTAYGYTKWDISPIFNEILIILWRGGNVRTLSQNIFEHDMESG